MKSTLFQWPSGTRPASTSSTSILLLASSCSPPLFGQAGSTQVIHSPPYEHDAYIWMRLTQSFYGSWLPSIAFLTLRQLRVSLPAAAMGGLLVLFELSFQTISRAIFLDPFLHLSIGLSFLSAVTLWNTRDRKMFWILTVSCGFWMGCAFSTKHTGLGVIGVVGVTHLIKTILPVFSNKFQTREGLLPLTPPRHHNKPQPLMERIENVLGGDMFLSGVVMLVLISFVYYMCFVIHFIVIKYAGVDQDSMPDAYLNTLIGNNITSALGQPAPSMFECIVHINRHMLKVNDATSFQHHHASQWQEWPLHYRGLVYWWRDVPESPGYHRCVYLFGNPLVYWLVLVGVLGSLYLIDKKLWCHFFEKIPMAPRQLALVTSGALCAFGWVANYLPYPLLVRRTCFVYHYHPSLYFGILCTAIVFDLLIHHMRTARRNLAWIATFVLVLGPILLTYFYYLPFSYALPLTDDEHEQRRKLYFFDSLRRLFPVW
eukprot:c18890_g1_i2.p1 GENE.c18890_g1_i2~~c18890_g1_i2.p1  ORF type:complete len:485 (-),score=67.83 c18890_g1_i2:36-1490(-)